MIFVTSISPNINNIKSQVEAIESWRHHGFPVYSVNTKAEIEKIEGLYRGVIFIETRRNGMNLYAKGGVFINDILTHTHAYTDDLICLMNSDIILDNNVAIMARMMEAAKEGMVIVSRYNIIPRNKPQLEEYGIDVFMFTKKLVKHIPMNLFIIGQPFWDYWLPYHCVKNRYELYYMNKPFASHRWHPVRWSHRNWGIAGEIFRSEIGYNGELEAFSRFIRHYFMSKAKVIKFEKELV